MPRRSVAQSKIEAEEETSSDTKNQEQPPPEEIDDAPEDLSTSSDTPTSRPRRVPKKNVLYNNDDYELSASDALKTAKTANAPVLTRESSVPRVTRKRTASSKQEKSKKKDTRSYSDSEESDKDAPLLEEEPDDVKVSFDDDGPPRLPPSIPFEGEEDVDPGSEEEDNDDEDEANPPDLERNPPSKKRGRPKTREPKPKKPVKFKMHRPTFKIPRPPPNERLVPRAMLSSQHFVKLFHSGLDTTPDGDSYATVISGCLTELLRKERIIELLTNPTEYSMMFDEGWMISKPPRLPPLINDKGTFVFYVDGHQCKNAKDISYDDLRPWSSTSDSSIPHSINIKPNVRRHPVAKLGGQLRIVKHETRLADYHLTEYSARLPREERLRKKIFYLTRDNCIYGNVLIIYNYIRPGNVPVPISLPHGNDLLRNAAVEEMDGVDHDSPFENETYEGLRGGFFLKLRPSKLGWAHNKKHLLDYLINKQNPFGTHNAINHRLPDLPPLIEGVGVFAYFVSAEYVINQIHHAADGLSPWTTIPGMNPDDVHAPRVRSTRKPLVTSDNDGSLQMARDPKTVSNVHLVETMSTLARCKRIRKRVFYIQQNSAILIGNVCYIYEFLYEGPLPELYPAVEMKQYNQRWQSSGVKKEEPGMSMPRMDMDNQDTFGNSMMIPLEDDDLEAEITHHKSVMDHRRHMVVEEDESLYPDMPPHGFDDEFSDDPIEKAENSDPYYEIPRQLSTGHVYLTVRHKKLVTSMDHVLEWIVNSNQVEERGILNETKPLHPPLVTNSRAYAFFVAATAIFPHDINRDDFSPWSHNGNAENPVCYRTKVRKVGVICDSATSHFMIKDNDYKSCPFHLVYLYSINPKDPRLRKKIYYMMETQSKMVVSHALIIYDYNTEGHVVKINTAGLKNPIKKFVTTHIPHHEYLEELIAPEELRDCPFRLPAQKAVDGTMYMQVTDNDFWNDRNRQIEYLVNQPQLVQQYACLNSKVPDLPPTCSSKGTFIFFINGEEVNFRSLTVDKLCPWSENACTNPNGITKRPKSSKTPLGLNANNHLRVLKSATGVPVDPTEYQLHIYTATLPRCTRLRKKVVYIQQNGRPFGNAMIMYCYTEHGPVPQPLEKYVPSLQEWFMGLEEPLRNEILDMLKEMTPEETHQKLWSSGIRVSINMLHLLKRQGHREALHGKTTYVTDWTDVTSSNVERTEEIVIEEEVPQTVMDHELMVEEEIVIESTEEITDAVDYDPSMSRKNPFLEKNVATSGFVRGAQRYDALWRIAQKHFGVNSIDETFDDIFKLLYEKNEERLLYMINHTFNVDIYGEDRPIYDDHVHFMGDQSELGLVEQTYQPHLTPTMERNVATFKGVPLNNSEISKRMNKGMVEYEQLNMNSNILKRNEFSAGSPPKRLLIANPPSSKPADAGDISDAESEKVMI